MLWSEGSSLAESRGADPVVVVRFCNRMERFDASSAWFLDWGGPEPHASCEW